MKIKSLKKAQVKIENISIGTDPELFMRSKESGEYVPSFFLIKGDKYNPTPISNKGHNISCDNVMFEYNIPPCKTAEEFVKENLFVQEYLKNTVAEPNGLELVIFPFADFTENNLMDERALLFGCDPDFNVWLGGKPNTVGVAGKTGRCSGGHIHVGYDNHNEKTNNLIVKALDLFLSVPLVLMEPNNKRKEMYGKAGAYRVQPWGVEYRSTSNYILSSPELMKWAFNQVLKAIDFIKDPKTVGDLDLIGKQIQSCINEKNEFLAQELINKYQLVLVEENKLVETI